MTPRFTKVHWAAHAVIYEVNIRQYTPEGTFHAFAAHLPTLKDMGITVLWLMPVTPISEKGRQGSLGSYYACNSYTAINPEFGTADDLRWLISQAHDLGMRVIVDWVANHTGMDHHWTQEHPEFFIRDEHGNFTERNGWVDVIDLNYQQPALRTAMIDAMQYWIHNFDVDGFRCDMAQLVPLDFWEEARLCCETIKPLYWLAECEDVHYHQVFDTTYAWEWMHVSELYTRGEDTLQRIRDVLHKYSQYPEGATKLYFTSNHDENSWNGTEYEKYGMAAKAWAVFACTWQGIPMVYSGQELPNQKRLAFFERDPIERIGPPALFEFYRSLLQLKATHPALSTEAETFILPTEHPNELLCYFRRSGEERVLVLLNVSNESRLQVTVTHEWMEGRYRSLFSGLSYNFQQTTHFELQAGEYLIYTS